MTRLLAYLTERAGGSTNCRHSFPSLSRVPGCPHHRVFPSATATGQRTPPCCPKSLRVPSPRVVPTRGNRPSGEDSLRRFLRSAAVALGVRDGYGDCADLLRGLQRHTTRPHSRVASPCHARTVICAKLALCVWRSRTRCVDILTSMSFSREDDPRAVARRRQWI